MNDKRNGALFLALAAMGLSGCGTLEGKLDNRLACSAAGDKAFVISEYGPVGISSTLSEKDKDALVAKGVCAK